ncbi:hypothetical protein A2382_04280 [Candidatus Woesebacteria bacterium RIFOXYB1_FULL_38_16]|uniref:Uncharacterized protein n=1 Tax=Candidatus Woesebacteria bacterium RIFOXYB1_FULL_38_16 TaxID=1802538 RepID=A0A1F8CVM6_9BACT|nr:MAG: hypothetical protein A2191_04360 [Candidatus Woesebacteria bacterium RIFOXYA1_FULL_38_9]OGM79788.1 MAG: hypothetical protein A2382_04280 [Candidatus Woesebacteria bacterium RIFOXYB1_FULL_38_16]
MNNLLYDTFYRAEEELFLGEIDSKETKQGGNQESKPGLSIKHFLYMVFNRANGELQKRIRRSLF